MRRAEETLLVQRRVSSGTVQKLHSDRLRDIEHRAEGRLDGGLQLLPSASIFPAGTADTLSPPQNNSAPSSGK